MKRERKPLSSAALAEVALRYLNRRDASRGRLQQYLERWVITRAEPADLEAARPLIAELLARYESSGLINDQRLANVSVEQLRARGRSSRAISYKLFSRGLPESAISAALAAETKSSAEADLEAARTLVRKRRLGPLRPEAERAANRRRDLACLARAGFDFDTAARALAVQSDDDF